MGVHAHSFSARPILPNCTTTFEQELSDEEKAEISLCNLSETVHAPGNQKNKGTIFLKHLLMILHVHSFSVPCIMHFSPAERLVPQRKSFVCELPAEVKICFPFLRLWSISGLR
jgi:hypothetical protein